jgi:serine phosphatase RsbU (regulator of sigma subunit)
MFGIVFRNSWITYLSRSDKYLYFIVLQLIQTIFYVVFDHFILGDDLELVAAQSIFYASATSLLSYFFKLYLFTTSVYLLLHLPTARIFDKKMKEIKFLHDLSTTINSEPDFNKLVLMITNMANEVTEANATWLEIYNEENKKLSIVSSKNLSVHETQSASLSRTEGLGGKVFFNKETIFIPEISKNREFFYLSRWKKEIKSIVAVPLITTKNKILGILYVAKSYDFGFDPNDIAMLEAFTNQVVIALENSKLIKDSVKRERLEQELKIARDVQQKLLPQDIPTIEKTDLDAIAFTANEVGGDYYDFILKNDQTFSVIVADVSGKGTSAAFYMAELKGIIKSLSTIYASSKDLLNHTNNVLMEHLEKKSFITAGMLHFDLEKKIATHLRAGHGPMIYYSSEEDKISYHVPKGIGLGLVKEKIFFSTTEEEKIDLASGDIFVLYTDGLNEARNIFGHEYGDERIGEIVSENLTNSAAEIKNAILDDVIKFAGKAKMHDDMTLAVIKIKL